MGRNAHVKHLSEIPKNNRQSDKIVSEIELNEVEEFIMSGSGDELNRATRLEYNDVNTPRMDYTGSGQQNETRIDVVKRSTMIGVNLFGHKADVDKKDKKVNFDNSESSDDKVDKHKRHYIGNF